MNTGVRTVTLISLFFIAGTLFGMHYDELKGLLGSPADQPSEQASQEKKPLYWVAPMDKNYRRDGPGLSPMGMELVPVYAEEETGGEGDVRISSAVENNLGVKTATVRRTDLYQPIETVGTVQFNESKITHLHSRVEGWIEVLNISSVGDRVKQGETLYELYSPALVNAQEEYLAALRSGNQHLTNASQSRLLALGLEQSQLTRLAQTRKVEQRVKVISEVDGVVRSLMVRQGMFIKPATEIASIAPLSSLWVIGDVLERQSALLALDQPVEVRVKGLPERVWEGKVNYIYPELNPQTRTLQLRVSLNNRDGLLKPNMLATLKIHSQIMQNQLAIPRHALIKSGQHQRVVKALGEGKYQSVLVKTGVEALEVDSNLKMVTVHEGLIEGEQVVSSAQFLIDSESSIEAELERMHSEMEAASDATAKKTVAPSNTVTTSGVINSVMADHAMLNITHEPIPAWDWPEMRMNFDVLPDIDLSQLNAGQEITFSILKRDQGGIIISEIEEPGSVKENKEKTANQKTATDKQRDHSAGKTVHSKHQTDDQHAHEHNHHDHGAMYNQGTEQHEEAHHAH